MYMLKIRVFWKIKLFTVSKEIGIFQNITVCQSIQRNIPDEPESSADEQ
jgi:hypothetical protein